MRHMLPKAKLIKIRFMKSWFAQVSPKRVMSVEKGWRIGYLKRRIFMKMRIANAMEIYVLFLNITIRMPWIGLAKANHIKYDRNAEIDA